ncbi:ATP-grasp domain-containing protein [Roseomonas chloroacetimidivorans]|uniref:ATP-grasp domain-containing protein n=1 Tax=Roseomonas chloroacetimidivorans TaxID=1766656 RepID=UPI003C7182BD
MRLIEAEGKALLARHGIAVPRGVMLPDGDFPADAVAWDGMVIKAQVLEGGRGRRGLVRRVSLADAAEARAAMRSILGPAHEGVGFLLEEALAPVREVFLALRVDGTRQGIELLFSASGGVAVEEGDAPVRLVLDPVDSGLAERVHAALRLVLPPALSARVAREAVRLLRVMESEDLTLLEINPLAELEGGRLMALDAKMVRDDAAASRHEAAATRASAALEFASLSLLERRAQSAGFTLVEMPGDVALVSAGAGLGMFLTDLLADHGLSAASFMDNAQGGPVETTEVRLEAAFDLAERPGVKAILFYATLASRPVGERIETLLSFLARRPAPRPLYVGFAAAPSASRGFDAAAGERLRAAGVAMLHDDPLTLVKAIAADLQPGGT